MILPCTFEEARARINKRFEAQPFVMDSFWEQHVKDSNHYLLVHDGETIGQFAIYKQYTLCYFHVDEAHLNKAQRLFAEARTMEQVVEAYVPTGDECFLALCLDNFSKIEKQAYFFEYGEVPTDIDVLTLVPIDGSNIELLDAAGNFMHEERDRIIEGDPTIGTYAAYDGDAFVGAGVIEKNTVIDGLSSIGMFICPEHRRKGYATRLMKTLWEKEHRAGQTVRSGCWYYNHYSKKTIEKIDGYTHTRLMKITF